MQSLPWKAGVGEAARGLHEDQPRAAELARHHVDVAAQDRREVGVDHGGVAAAHQLHQRAGLVADVETWVKPTSRAIAATAPPRASVIAVAVHEHDGAGAQAPGEGRLQRGAQRRLVERLDFTRPGR
jgi:hypothetical protein